MKKNYYSALLILLLLMSSCGAYFNQPLSREDARIGEETSNKDVLKGILPQKPIVVGVYKFRDLTGQYKKQDNGISYSTAITQGGTAILIKALEDSKWFVPIERENVSDLLNERQIIRSTRQQYSQNKNTKTQELPPLLFAGLILEGGVVSYDYNTITGGAGVKYFGSGSSTSYRQDRITVYLRAVSTSSGKILKTVYISKTILSQAINANLFRYVKLKKLLEAETGFTKTEPGQLAVKDAIDKAVETIILQGIKDGLWLAKGGEPVARKVDSIVKSDNEIAASTKLYNRSIKERRSVNAFGISLGNALMDGDYANPNLNFNVNFELKRFISPHLFLAGDGGVFRLSNKNAYKDNFFSLDLNLGYVFLPYDNLTPFVYAGGGIISNFAQGNTHPKGQYGVGLEYFPSKNIGVKIYGEQNILRNDNLDRLVQGKRDDFYWRFGFGINVYFARSIKKNKKIN